MDSLISVIVPVYNVGEYLSRRVDSILKQTYSNLEIILVDDGSTDDSGHICDTYIPRDSRIRVIHKKNGGLSSARNAGIEKAKGEYLSFIDSDDYIHPEFYERLYTAIMENDADVAVCNFKQVAHGTETDTGERKVSKFVGKQSIMDNFYNSNCAASVVAWEAPGPGFIIEDGISGCLADSDEGILQAIFEKNIDPNCAKQRVLSCFTWENTAKKILRIAADN